MFLLVSVRQVWCLSTWAPAWRLHTNLFAPKLGNRCFCWFPSAKFGAHPGGHQHGFSIQISINLGKTFLRISRIHIFFWPESWLGTWYIYLLSFPRFRTLSIERFWFLFWSILNGVTLKTSNCNTAREKSGEAKSETNLQTSVFDMKRVA